jgi:hypothetical protein
VTGGAGTDVGGLIGAKGASLAAASYSTGLVSGGPESCVGGFIGSDTYSPLTVYGYWDTDTSGTDQSTCGAADAIGLTTEQLKSGLPAGFDPKIWAQSPNINNGYPYLLANPPPKK